MPTLPLARPVLDHHRLAEDGRERLRHRPAHHVRDAAGVVGHEDAERPVGEAGGGGRGALAGRNRARLEEVRGRLAAIDPRLGDLTLLHADSTDEDLAFNGPVLAPGFGAQGGTVDDVRRLFGAAATVLPSTSREVLRLGPGADAMADFVRRTNDDLRA